MSYLRAKQVFFKVNCDYQLTRGNVYMEYQLDQYGDFLPRR